MHIRGDKGLANGNFLKHSSGAIMLDTIGYCDGVVENDTEKILELSDWMGIPLEPCKIPLGRLKDLLLDQIQP
jgi:hypothetical protein